MQRILSLMHEAGGRLRVVGSALSPSGLGLSDEAMLNLSPHCTAVLSIDAEKRQATVQAGARVSEVVEELRPHGLTLQNYASIAEQQIGGFLQVGAHGTGAAVPPVDEQVVRMVLHTPALGPLELSAEHNPRLFYLAKARSMWACGHVRWSHLAEARRVWACGRVRRPGKRPTSYSLLPASQRQGPCTASPSSAWAGSS